MYLLNNKMKIDFPENFQCISDEDIMYLFQGEQKPQVVVRDDKNAIIAFFLTDKMVESMQLESIMSDFYFMLRQKYPANLFLEKTYFDLYFNKLVWMGFKGNTSSKYMYYLLFITVIDGKLLMGMFQCEWNQMVEQKPQILHILKGIVDVRNEKEGRGVYE